MSDELTMEERAAEVLSRLAETMPTSDEVLHDAPLPGWMTEPWVAALTDPTDPQFPTSVVKAEAWLATH